MKMRIVDRILLTLLMLVVLALSVGLILLSVGAITADGVSSTLTAMFESNWVGSVIGCIVGVLLLAFAVKVLFVRARQSAYAPTVLIKATEIGTIRITLVALDQMVQNFAKSLPSVRNVKSTIISREDSASIVLRVSVMPDAIVPEVTQNLQQGVKAHVEQHAGILVSDVQIVVETASVNPPRTGNNQPRVQ